MNIKEYTESIIPTLRRLFPFEAKYNEPFELDRKEAELFQSMKEMTLTDAIQKLESIKFETNSGYYPKAESLGIKKVSKETYDYINHFQKMRNLYHPKATREYLAWLKERIVDNDHSVQFDGKLWDDPWTWNYKKMVTGDDYTLAMQGWDHFYNNDPRFMEYMKNLERQVLG